MMNLSALFLDLVEQRRMQVPRRISTLSHSIVLAVHMPSA